MNSQQARKKLDAEVDKVVIAAYERNEPEIERGPVMAAADVLMLAVRLAVIDEILDGEYTLEQVADLRKNIEEGLQGGNA